MLRNQSWFPPPPPPLPSLPSHLICGCFICACSAQKPFYFEMCFTHIYQKDFLRAHKCNFGKWSIVIIYTFIFFFLQSASQLTKRDPSIHPPHGPSPSTIGQPSNMSAASTMLGPSPFERQHSMVHGLKASLPKLPSFKVKRTVQPPQHDKDPGLSLKRSGADSPVPSETATKRPCPEDSEVDTELDSSRGPDRRHRTTSRMEEEERSESPWQHLEDSMDMAPPATRVRSTIGELMLHVVSTHIGYDWVVVHPSPTNQYRCIHLWVCATVGSTSCGKSLGM